MQNETVKDFYKLTLHLTKIKAFTLKEISKKSKIPTTTVSAIKNTGEIPVNVKLSTSLMVLMQKFIKDYMYYYAFEAEDIKYAKNYTEPDDVSIKEAEITALAKEKEFRRRSFEPVSKALTSSCFFASQTDPFVTGKRFLDD